MGGIVTMGGSKIGSALNEIAQQNAAKKTYRSLVDEADKQAQLVKEQAKQEEINLLRSAAQERLERYQKYRQEQSAQKAAFAAAGLDESSASVQQFLQNQQWQSKLDDVAAGEELAKNREQTRQKTEEQLRALQAKTESARQSYVQKKNGWKLGSKFVSFFSRG